MNYQIETIPAFDHAIRRLAKKYRRIKHDLSDILSPINRGASGDQTHDGLVATLMANPWSGVAIPGYAHQVWKIRLASTDM